MHSNRIRICIAVTLAIAIASVTVIADADRSVQGTRLLVYNDTHVLLICSQLTKISDWSSLPTRLVKELLSANSHIPTVNAAPPAICKTQTLALRLRVMLHGLQGWPGGSSPTRCSVLRSTGLNFLPYFSMDFFFSIKALEFHAAIILYSDVERGEFMRNF